MSLHFFSKTSYFGLFVVVVLGVFSFVLFVLLLLLFSVGLGG